MKNLLLYFLDLFMWQAEYSQTETELKIDIGNTNDISISKTSENTFQILTEGTDPYVVTRALEAPLSPEHRILSFEYFCPKGLDHLQIYFGPDFINKLRISNLEKVPFRFRSSFSERG